ncbi:MAG: carbonic anhydrase [Isosphaeraceae bacterium]
MGHIRDGRSPFEALAPRQDEGSVAGPASRRGFLQRCSLLAGVAGFGLPTVTGGLAAAAPVADGPDAVLKRLMEGNARFRSGQTSLLTRRRPEDFAALAEGQAPEAVIVACADSRVAPELIFDQGVGDLFVVRIAGNLVSGAGATVKGSIEFAVAELGARLIVVLGHSACGAVKAAIAHIDANDTLPGSIRDLVEPLRPVAASVRGKPGDKLENAIAANVRNGVETLKGLNPILSGFVKKGELKIVGGVYELRSGEVKLLD